MKLILLIAVWRITEVQKFNEMNPECKKAKSDMIVKEEKEVFSKTQKAKTNGKFGNTFNRPTIRRDKTLAEGKVGLRDTEVFEKV